MSCSREESIPPIRPTKTEKTMPYKFIFIRGFYGILGEQGHEMVKILSRWEGKEPLWWILCWD